MKAILTYYTNYNDYDDGDIYMDLLNFDISVEKLNELLNKLEKIGYYDDDSKYADGYDIEVIEIPDEYVNKTFKNTKKTKEYIIDERIEYKILIDYDWYNNQQMFTINKTGLNSYGRISTLYGKYQVTKLSKQDMIEKIQMYINKMKEKYKICMDIEKEYSS